VSFFKKSRSRPMSEAVAYARCHGARDSNLVRVSRVDGWGHPLLDEWCETGYAGDDAGRTASSVQPSRPLGR
jgi:hypothetical protein